MDERIDIEVVDKVAKTIKPELLGISAAAKNAYTQIAKLKRELGVTGGAGMGASMKAVASAERDASRASRERATQAQATARALDKEAAAAARLATKYQQQARAASSQAAYNKSAGIGGARKSAADSYSVFDKAGVIDKTSASLDTLGKKAELGRHHMLNLGFQLQDLVVSLQAGQNPLTVFIQQGGQIGQIMAQAGVGIGGMAKAVAGIALRFLPFIAGVGAAGVAVYGLYNYFIAAEKEANIFNNTLRLSGNYAGLTASSYKEMAKSIADSTSTSVGSNKTFISSLAATNKFTKDQIKSLILTAQDLARATGQSADDIVEDFAKMGEGPTAYAEIYQQKYPGIITPEILAHIRLLEETGRAHEALKVTIDTVTTGVAEKTTEQTGIIYKGWMLARKGVLYYLDALSNLGKTSTTQDKIDDLTGQINKLITNQNGAWIRTASGDAYYDKQIKNLINQRAALQSVARSEEDAAKAESERTARIIEGDAAAKKWRDTYAGLTDSTVGYKRAVQDLDATLAKMKANNDPGYAAAFAQRDATAEALRKKYMPATVAAEKKKTPKGPKSDAEKLADKLKEINRDLALEAARLAQNLVGMDATIAERMASIEDSIDGVAGSLKDAEGNWTSYGKKVLASITDQVTVNEQGKESLAALGSLYESVIAPTERWEAAQEAAAIALKKFGKANEQAGIHRWLALQKEAYIDATNPLRQYEKAVKDQIALQKYYGRELQIQTEIQRRYNEQLALQPNITPDRNKIGNDVRSDMAKNERNSALGSVEGNMAAEQIRMLQLQIDAYKELGGASLEASNAIRDLRIQQNQLAVEAGTANWQTTFVTGLSKVVEGFKGVKAGVMDLTATMMGSFVDGISNSIGRAIVMGDSLRDSLKQVGQTILTELISGLVKLAIQFGINQLVSATLGSAALATTAVQATAAAAMWAPAAALASLATLGANAAPAAAAIVGTTALTSALAMFSGLGFQKGGYTGDMPAHAATGVVHGREYVMDAATTARIGVPTLDALRSGRLNPGPANDNNRGLNVKIINNGNDDVKVQELSDGELMVIIDKRLDAKFDRTMQQKLSNPNSGSSKAISSNFKTVRNRN